MEENSVIVSHYKQHKNKINADYYNSHRKDLLRKAVIKRICRMQGKISAKTLKKYKITEEEINEIEQTVYSLVKEKQITIVSGCYDTTDPQELEHALHFVRAYYSAVKRRLNSTCF